MIWHILTLFHLGGGQICPHPAQTCIPEKYQWMETLMIFVYSLMYVRYVSNHFPFGQGITELVRNVLFSWGGTLTNGAKVASARWNVKKNFFFSNSYISRTKWQRHQTWVLNWRFLQELKCEPIFEQVTLSWSSGEKENAWGQICPGC